MAKVVQRRRGTTSEHSSFTGLVGEITVNTTTKTAIVHDGATAGGFALARSDGSNLVAAAGTISGASLVGNSIGIGQLNVADGTAGQVLSTDGSANLSFINVGLTALGISDGTAGQVLSTNGAGTFSFISVGLTSLGITDGTVGQILQTDGSGNLSFVDKPADGADGAGGISLGLAIAIG
jgi:hypothetical protein